ncbi:hypothetical protein K0M31_015995 [Melipona bicolor]|uniref:Uncharacterized protein n=1 Tax=Melipona bicolor TaxID=60889 RepID=A0AA40G679_9HYME|nr:hypothetical protein K0M31_015995 [Melipona bicolor]
MRQEFGNIQSAQSATGKTEMLTKRANEKQASLTQKTWNVSAIADYLAECRANSLRENSMVMIGGRNS